MGNEAQKANQKNETLIKGKNSDNAKNTNKSIKSVKVAKDFNRFKEMILHYEYYHKLLKLTFRNNPVLKILYQPEGSFNNYYMKMFYILEEITYINYQECIKLAENSHTQNEKLNEKNNNQKNVALNVNKVKFDLSSNNSKNKQAKRSIVLSYTTLNHINRPNLKKTASFDISIPDKNSNSSKFLTYINGEKNLYHELIYIMEKICLYDIKKIQKILLIYPINNLRWIIWLAMARSKYNKIQRRLNVSNTDIYNELVNKVELKDDSLMFELHNTLKEIKVFKCNWSTCLYKIIKCLLLYKKDFQYESGMNILIGVPLLISDCNEEDTFFFARYLFSSYYGLGLCYFFGEDELLLNYLVFIVHELTKERLPKVYDYLCKLNIADELWIKKWIKTFFSSIFDLSITIRVWDCVIGVGLKFLVNFSLAIFDYFKDRFLPLKKVKYFLEFFDYDLRNKYKKKKEVLLFREEIIRLAQSYNIPDGKYQLLEKEYISFLFSDKDKKSSDIEHFDTSKTINNYYSNNDSLDDEQYHIKLILRTLIYIPSEYLQNNVEDNIIYKFKKKKTTKWLESQKTLKKIEEMEKDSDISYLNNINENKEMKIYSSKNNSFIDSKNNLERKSSRILKYGNSSSSFIKDNDNASNPIKKFYKNKINRQFSINNKLRKINSMKNIFINTSKEYNISDNKISRNLLGSSSNITFNNIIKNSEENNEEKEDNKNYDVALDLSFHEEQLPDYVKE